LIISPDSAVCPLVAAAIFPLAGADPDARVALAGLLALTVGMIMLAGGLARFGFVTELLSMPVRVGCSASSTSAPPAGCTGGAAASSRSPSPRSPASPCSACCGASGSRSPCRS